MTSLETTLITEAGLRFQYRKRQLEDTLSPITTLIKQLDTHRGAVFSSNFEYPGRYTQWDIGFIDPPLMLVSRGYMVIVTALNHHGQVFLPLLEQRCMALEGLKVTACREDKTSTSSPLTELVIQVIPTQTRFPEEARSQQPSVFTVVRALWRLLMLSNAAENHPLGLYGAFGYDLAFQFEAVDFKQQRDPNQRDLVLYLPDRIIQVDHRRQMAIEHCYTFDPLSVEPQETPSASQTPTSSTSFSPESTKLPESTELLELSKSMESMATSAKASPTRAVTSPVSMTRSLPPGGYAALVEKAIPYFARGDLFEVVPGQQFSFPCQDRPSTIFNRLRSTNPSPYGFMMNLGDDEYLVGTSPEMFVRVHGRHVETRPISGTIARGRHALEDAEQIRTLLNSAKDESELTMCTDVDRNDKSRICEPGSVQVTGRREIERYAKLFHTVDHVEGVLREGYDALDAFLTHTWAVTVTGAPKHAAMQFIEDYETTPRAWYGGAVGWLQANGDMNTGLTIRTIHIKEGVASIRAGATLLYDSDPNAEERETELKASAMIDAVTGQSSTHIDALDIPQVGIGKRVLLIDHEDSFVHTLANYIRQVGCTVITQRHGLGEAELRAIQPDLVVLSPGPGRPSDFHCHKTIEQSIRAGYPIFGVCLGLQAMVEYFGGTLHQLAIPTHGKSSTVQVMGGQLFEKLPSELTVARYHSLYAKADELPACLTLTAKTEDGIVMALAHQTLPIWGTQFHPESILSAQHQAGLRMIANAVRYLLTF